MPDAKSYSVQITPAAWQIIIALPQKTQDQIFTAFENLEIEPRPGNSKLLRHEWRGHRRVRVGDYRVIYTIEEDVLIVVVVKIGNRRDIYE